MQLSLVKTEVCVPEPASSSYHKGDEYVKSWSCLQLLFPLRRFFHLMDGRRNLGNIFIAKFAPLSLSNLEFSFASHSIQTQVVLAFMKGVSDQDVGCECLLISREGRVVTLILIWIWMLADPETVALYSLVL